MRPGRVVWMAAWIASGTTSVSAYAQQNDDCEFKRPISMNVAMSSGDALRAEAGAGSLEVRGVQGLREARVTGTACASNAQLLREIDVNITRENGRVVIETEFPEDRSSRDDWNRDQSRIDLVIEVPAGTDADIDDGSGSLEVSGLGNTEIDDGSGELVISGVTGTLDIQDGSGSIEISDVGGDVRIVDGSGEVTIRDAGGSVEVSDGSGSINVRGVRGGFTVSSDGSGEVEWTNVTGRVDVPTRKRGRSD